LITRALLKHDETNRDVLGQDLGETFLAEEMGLKGANLTDEAKIVAKLVGYQKQALMIVANLANPISKKKWPKNWREIYDYLTEIRNEIGIVDAN